MFAGPAPFGFAMADQIYFLRFANHRMFPRDAGTALQPPPGAS
jgi:hypothetical protein